MLISFVIYLPYIICVSSSLLNVMESALAPVAHQEAAFALPTMPLYAATMERLTATRVGQTVKEL